MTASSCHRQADGTARVWSSATGRSEAVLRGHTIRWVADAAFSPDETSVATARPRRRCRLDAAVSRPVWSGKRCCSGPPRSDRAAGVVVIGGDAPVVRILSDKGRVLRELVQPATAYGAASTPDGRFVLTDDSQVSFASGTCRLAHSFVVPAASRPARSRSAADGCYLTAPTMQGAIGIWSVATLRRLRVMGPRGRLNAAAFSPDDRLIGGAAKDGLAWLLSSRTGYVVHVLPVDRAKA